MRKYQEKIIQIVKDICATPSSGCRSLNKSDMARQLLNLANVPEGTEICEIPLDWDDQVVVLFLVPNDNNYYSLFAGIGTDGKFYFQLSITGTFDGNRYFDFWDEEKIIPIDYFKEDNIMTEKGIKELLCKKFGYTFTSAEGKLATNFRQDGNSVFYDVNPDSVTGYTVEISLVDGATRHCGFGEGCFWTEWEGDEEE